MRRASVWTCLTRLFDKILNLSFQLLNPESKVPDFLRLADYDFIEFRYCAFKIADLDFKSFDIFVHMDILSS